MHAFSKDNLKAMCWALCIVFFGALLSTAWNRFAATSYASCAAVASPSAMMRYREGWKLFEDKTARFVSDEEPERFSRDSRFSYSRLKDSAEGKNAAVWKSLGGNRRHLSFIPNNLPLPRAKEFDDYVDDNWLGEESGIIRGVQNIDNDAKHRKREVRSIHSQPGSEEGAVETKSNAFRIVPEGDEASFRIAQE